MDNSIIIKASNNGISFTFDENLTFDEIKEKFKEKIIDSKNFLSKGKTAVAFEGKKLSDEEAIELLQIISDNSDIEVVCLIDKDEETNKKYMQALKNLPEKTEEAVLPSDARIYKGSLRSGQSIEQDASVIILGDVNPGASIVSAGNIIVLGTLKGTAFAGCSGNKKCFVIALDMIPMQIRIADIIARAPDNPERVSNKETKIACVEGDTISIAPISKEVFNSITIN